jgi:hypothetical protein
MQIADSTGVVSFTSNPVLTGGTANGVAFANGSKVLTTAATLIWTGATQKLGFQNAAASGYGYIYNAGAGTNTDLGFEVGGSEQMRLTSTGLGIGTSSPKLNTNAGTFLTVSNTTSDQAGWLELQGAPASTGSGSGFLSFNNSNKAGADKRIAQISGFRGSAADSGAIGFATWNAGVGAEQMRLDSSGNLGLGVTPSAWDSFIPRAIELPNGVGFASQSNAPVAHFSANAYYDGSWRYKATGVAARYALGSNTHAWYTAPSGTAGDAISFTQAMTLDASSNLMVNRTSVLTGSKVSVDGSLGLNGPSGDGVLRLYTAGTQYGGIASAAWAFGGGASTTDLTVLASNNLILGTNGSERARITSGGDFGIGTTSPAQKLDVTGNIQTTGTSGWVTDGNTAFVYFGDSNNRIGGVRGSDMGFYTDYAAMELSAGAGGGSPSATQLIKFKTANAERARIDSSGNLLVGTTNNDPKASAVTGVVLRPTNLEVSTFGTGGFFNLISGTGTLISFRQANTVVGSIDVTASLTTYNTTSDYRLKTVIGPVVDAGQRIDALQPVEYTWNSNGASTRGFLAHQFQEVYAGSVSGTKDAVDEEGKPVYQSMQASTSEVIADLVAELQSLRARLAAANI